MTVTKPSPPPVNPSSINVVEGFMSSHLLVLSLLYISFMLICNIAGEKVTMIAGLHISAGAIFFPLTYILDDVITEVYGFNVSRRLIWLGLIAAIAVIGVLMIMVKLPSSPHWQHQEAYNLIFSMSPRLFGASLTAYLCGEFINAIILAKLKVKTKGRYLWFRIIASSILGQGLDSLIVTFGGFYGMVPIVIVKEMAINEYFFKILSEIITLPLTYWLVAYLKRKDNCDVYDYQTRFNPFVLK